MTNQERLRAGVPFAAPPDPVAASYVELTVAIVTLQEHVRTLERAQRDTAANLHALLALNGKQIDLLRKIAELLEDE